MGTSNFHSQEDFPLIAVVSDNFTYENDEGEAVYDDWACRDWIKYTLEPALKEFNSNLSYHEVIIKDGYYDGLQLFVNQNETYYDEDEEAQKKEAEELAEKMVEFGTNLGMMVLQVTARFSNGETWYQKVDIPPKV